MKILKVFECRDVCRDSGIAHNENKKKIKFVLRRSINNSSKINYLFKIFEEKSKIFRSGRELKKYH